MRKLHDLITQWAFFVAFSIKCTPAGHFFSVSKLWSGKKQIWQFIFPAYLHIEPTQHADSLQLHKKKFEKNRHELKQIASYNWAQCVKKRTIADDMHKWNIRWIPNSSRPFNLKWCSLSAHKFHKMKWNHIYRMSAVPFFHHRNPKLHQKKANPIQESKKRSKTHWQEITLLHHHQRPIAMNCIGKKCGENYLWC